jgi:hypothetical protein
MGSGMATFAARQLEAALVPDGQNRTDQVLVRAHSSGHAVHDDADFSLGHTHFLADAMNIAVFVSMYKFGTICKWKLP